MKFEHRHNYMPTTTPLRSIQSNNILTQYLLSVVPALERMAVLPTDSYTQMSSLTDRPILICITSLQLDKNVNLQSIFVQ